MKCLWLRIPTALFTQGLLKRQVERMSQGGTQNTSEKEVGARSQFVPVMIQFYDASSRNAVVMGPLGLECSTADALFPRLAVFRVPATAALTTASPY